MKRFREGYIWTDPTIGMIGIYDNDLNIDLYPVDKYGQIMFRFMVEKRK